MSEIFANVFDSYERTIKMLTDELNKKEFELAESAMALNEAKAEIEQTEAQNQRLRDKSFLDERNKLIEKAHSLTDMLVKILNNVPCQAEKATWAKCAPHHSWDYCCICEARRALKEKND